MLACHWNAAHDVPRALGASRRGRAGVQARARLQRGPAPLRARARAVGPRPRRRGARGLRPRRRAAPRRGGRRLRRRVARSLALARRRSPRSTRRPTRCGPRSSTSGSATTCAGPARPRRASRPTTGRWSCSRTAKRRARPAARVPRARADAARALRGGRSRAARRRSRWPSAAATTRSRSARSTRSALARRARRRRGGHRDAARSRDLARPRTGRSSTAGDHQPQRGARPRGPHRGGAGRGRGRHGDAARQPRAHVLRHVHGAAGRQPPDQARPAARARARLPTPKFGDAVGTTPIFLAELRARLALLTGDLDEARRQLDEFRRLCLGTRDPQWMEPLHAAGGAARAARGPPGDARDAIRRGLASLERPRRARGSSGWRGSA